MLFIFKITRNSLPRWDENAGHVIVAETAEQVRDLAAKAAADESPREWEAGRATVVRLGVYTKNRKTPYITLTDCRNG